MEYSNGIVDAAEMDLANAINNLTSEKLKDDHINSYMRMLNVKYGATGRVKFLDSYFFTTLKMSKANGTLKIKATKFIKLFLTDNNTLPELVIIPVHTLDVHWTVICVYLYTRHIVAIDSYDSRQDIFTRRESAATVMIKGCFSLLVESMKLAKLDWRFNNVFKSPYPWIYVRGFHLSPQTDEDSCGFFALLVSRLCGSVVSLDQGIAFDLGEIEPMKRRVSLELVDQKLPEELVQIDGLVFPGIEKTANCRISSSHIGSGMIYTRCIMNPNYISYKIFSNYLVSKGRCEETYKGYIDSLHSVKEGGNFTVAIEPISDDPGRIADILYVLSTAFECMSTSVADALKKKLELMRIIIQSDTIYDCISESSSTVALELDYQRNGITFNADGKEKGNATMVFHDVLANYYHAFCRHSARFELCIVGGTENIPKMVENFTDKLENVLFEFVG